ncbi:MAG TPA: FtsQ-type POTRA domain-containing protein [Thermoanaerobaculia bacterium]|nr:FtsQ-type POTRA domain-containing protein [Thermoanaerobaculia bacterium]
MSSSFDSTASRFLRPTDVARIRRNQRRIQVQRVLVIARNVGLALAVIAGAIWAYRHTQSDARFSVKQIEIEGAVHTQRAALDVITQRYVGLNLFQIDIARVQRDLGGLAWVSRIDIEKKLPDTLRIKIAERTPVALIDTGAKLMYVDEQGAAFAQLSPAVGDDDLPLIRNAAGSEIVRTVAAIRELRQRDPQVFSRISEIRPVAPRGFALFDRDLGATVYANADDFSEKYRELYGVMQAENVPAIEYADLRFSDRIVIKPSSAERRASAAARPTGVEYVQN